MGDISPPVHKLKKPLYALLFHDNVQFKHLAGSGSKNEQEYTKYDKNVSKIIAHKY